MKYTQKMQNIQKTKNNNFRIFYIEYIQKNK